MAPVVLTIFFHNYYGDHLQWIKLLCEKINHSFILLYNIVEDSHYNLDNPINDVDILQNLPFCNQLTKIIIRKSSNKGKDIGGKLVLLDTYLRLGIESDYMLFLHDKYSPHKSDGKLWQEKLFRITDKDFADAAIDFLRKNAKLGVIAASGTIIGEEQITMITKKGSNAHLLEDICSDFNIGKTDARYVAGTMFWARTSPVELFYRKHSPLTIRQNLESGNVMDEITGSFTHAWERIFTWLITYQGYTIKELE